MPGAWSVCHVTDMKDTERQRTLDTSEMTSNATAHYRLFPPRLKGHNTREIISEKGNILSDQENILWCLSPSQNYKFHIQWSRFPAKFLGFSIQNKKKLGIWSSQRKCPGLQSRSCFHGNHAPRCSWAQPSWAVLEVLAFVLAPFEGNAPSWGFF